MINFPQNPVLGQKYSAGIKTWAYNGRAWELQAVPDSLVQGVQDTLATALAQLAVESDNPPASPKNGQEWIDATTGRRYTWNANSACWAETYIAVTIDNPSLVTQLRSDLAADTGAALMRWPNGGTPLKVSEALDILYYGVANVRNPKYAGGAKGGAVDDTAAYQAAIDSGIKLVYAPGGTYSTGTLTLPVDVSLIGDGERQTIINSLAIGGSHIKTSSPNGVQVGVIRDLQLVGNGLTGAAGNGHAINFVDPLMDSGAWTPQGMTVERVWIKNYRGTDSRDNAGTKIASAGIICVQGLQNIYRDVTVHACGHGFYLSETQTNKISNCVAYLCDKAGIFTYLTVGTIIEQCDIVGNGASGTTDAGYPATDLGMGNVISSYDEALVISRNKFKNTSGQAQLYFKLSHGVVVSENWIRSDIDSSRAIVVNNGLKTLKCAGLKVRDNTFSCVIATGTDITTVKAKHVNITSDSTNEIFNFDFSGNLFVTQPGLKTEYALCVEGVTGNAVIYSGCIIDNNRFGTPLVVNSAIVNDDDILVRNCGFTHSRITNNVHYAQTNVTRTRCITGTNLSAESNNYIQQNVGKVNGGTIVTFYSGFLYPTKRQASKTYDPPALTASGTAGATTSTTFSVNNALVGEPVTVNFNKPLLGVLMWGEVTSNTAGVGTVTVYLANTTNATVDLPSGSLGVIVDRSSSAEVN